MGKYRWLYSKLGNVDFVPVAIHIHTLRSDKPELHLHVGEPAQLDDGMDNKQRTSAFQDLLASQLIDLRRVAGFDDNGFELLI